MPLKTTKKVFTKSMITGWLIFILSYFYFPVPAQESQFDILTIDQAVDSALNNNFRLKNAQLELEQAELSKKNAIDIPSTEFKYQYGQIFSPINDRYIEINQNFGSLLTHIKRYKSAENFIELNKAQFELTKKEVIAEVKSAYFFWLFQFKKLEILQEKNEYYSDLTRIADLNYKLGETDLQEKVTVTALHAQTELDYNTAQDELTIAQNKLKQLIVVTDDILPDTIELELYMIDKPSPSTAYNGGPVLNVYENKIDLERTKYQTEKSKFFPEISVGYFNQSIGALNGFQGWQARIAFPLWFFPQSSKIQQARINEQMAENSFENKKFQVEHDVENLLFELNKYFKQIIYFKEYALPQAEILMQSSEMQFKKEELEYKEFLQGISTALNLKLNYYETLNNYNQTAIQLEFYAN